MKRDVGIRAFVSGKGSVEVLGTKVKGECGEHRWNHLTFTLPLYLCVILRLALRMSERQTA